MFHTSERPGGVAAAARPAEPRVSVVVPARNEARDLELLLPALPEVHEVILVDGDSVDDTIATARRLVPDIRVTRQRDRDEGQALAAGLAEVTGDVVVMLDADSHADPREIPRLVEALVDGADVAQASRFGAGDPGLPPARRLGNALLARVARRVLGHQVSDLRYGFDAFWADLLPVVEPARGSGGGRARLAWGNGFEAERTVISCRLAAADASVTEVPSVPRRTVRGGDGLGALSGGLRVLTTLLTESRRVRSGAHLVVQRSEPRVPRQRPGLVLSGRVSP